MYMHACIDTQTTNIHTDTTLTRIYSHKHLLSFQLDIDACNGTQVPRYVQKLMEVSFVIVAIYWILMELLVMVCSL